jgi:hypothetical protein
LRFQTASQRRRDCRICGSAAHGASLFPRPIPAWLSTPDSLLSLVDYRARVDGVLMGSDLSSFAMGSLAMPIGALCSGRRSVEEKEDTDQKPRKPRPWREMEPAGMPRLLRVTRHSGISDRKATEETQYLIKWSTRRDVDPLSSRVFGPITALEYLAELSVPRRRCEF